MIVRHWPNTVIMIDDFKVPFDEGFHWDKYDDQREICLQYIADSIGANPVYFPSYPARQEGVRIARGYCVIPTSERYAREIERITLLRRFS
jgi:hypothetical protein